MSDPAAPVITPEAPAATPEPPKPAEPAAAAPEAPKAEANPWEDPAAAKAEIERLRKENGKDRTNAKQAAAAEAEAALARKIGEALGLIKGDEPADPSKLTEQLTATQAEAKQARVELAVFKNADAAGADPQALLDSASFLKKAAALDPSDVDALQAAMREAVEANPRLGAAPGLPKPNPAQGSSGGGQVPDDIDAQIAAASKAGNHRLAIALKRQKAYAQKT